MKKLLSIMLISLMLIALLASCSKPVNTNTDSQGNESTNTGTNIDTSSKEDTGNETNINAPEKSVVELRNEKVRFAIDANSHTINNKLEYNITEYVGYIETNELGNEYIVYAPNAFNYYVHIMSKKNNNNAGWVYERILEKSIDDKKKHIDVIEIKANEMLIVFPDFNTYSYLQEELLNELSALDSVENVVVGYIEVQKTNDSINNSYEIYANLGEKYKKNAVFSTYEDFYNELGDFVNDYEGLEKITNETFENNYVFVITNQNYSDFKISDAYVYKNIIYFTNNVLVKTAVATNLILNVDSCVVVIPKESIGVLPDNPIITLLEAVVRIDPR